MRGFRVTHHIDVNHFTDAQVAHHDHATVLDFLSVAA